MDALPTTNRTDDEAAALRATGTDGAGDAQQYAQQREHDPMRLDATGRGGDSSADLSGEDAKPYPFAGLRDDAQPGAGPRDKATDRNRTGNLQITNQVLCQLSYGGVATSV